MTSAPKGLYAYAWDVIDEGPDAVLDGVERAGLNALFIATWYHSGHFFLPHNPRRRVHFPTPGALYFQPGAWHATHPLAPAVSDLTDDWPRMWEDLARRASARGIGLTAWMPVLHNSGMATAHPQVAVRNAWGDVITHSPCAAVPEVAEVVEQVMRDVARMGIFDRVMLESIEYLGLRHGHHHEVIGVDPGPDIEFLLALSFSDAVMARAAAAGVDAEAVRAWVRKTCDAALDGSPRAPMGWAGIEAGADGEVGRFLRLREDAVSEVMERAVSAIRAEAPGIRVAALDFGPLYALGPNGRRWQNGVDLDRQLPLIDEIHPTFYQTDPDLRATKIAEYGALIGGAVPVVPAVRAVLPQTDSAENLAGQVAALRGIADGYVFYNYSFMALPVLDWIRAALEGEARP